ncbi:MAG: hypothetical protein RR336_01095 [Oscillospiraceae bacterium]
MERGVKCMVIRRRSGNVVEESTVYVDPNVKPRRNKRKGATTAEKQEGNENSCARRLGRAINCNFSFGDLWTTPKYDDEGYARLTAWAEEHRGAEQSMEDALIEAAEREGQNYMRRVAWLLKKKGVQNFRYILITTDMDGKTGEAVRPHHHLIAPRISFEEAAKCWTLGTVDYQTLKQQDDYTPLAVYLMRQVRRRPDAKKYTCSRNLKKPLVNERWAKPGEVLKPDRGGKLVDCNEWQPGRPQYIRFVKQGRASGAEDLDQGVSRHGKVGACAPAGACDKNSSGAPPGEGAGQ